jgi:hypothetical protein
MIRTLRAFFLGRLLREKLLLVAFAAIGLLWWASAFSTRAGRFTQERRRTTAALAEQQQWLDHRLVIEAAAQKAAAQLKPELTLDGTRLLADVSSIAREAGLRNVSGGSLTTKQSNGQFSIHTLDYTVNRSDWNLLRKFYESLQKRTPYIGIEHFQLTADGVNPAQLSLSLRVSSVEITR